MVFSKERYAERRARKNAAKARAEEPVVETPAEEAVVEATAEEPVAEEPEAEATAEEPVAEEAPEPRDVLPSLEVLSAFLAADPAGNEGSYRTALHAYKSYEEGAYSFEKAKALIDEALGLGEPPADAEQAEEEPSVAPTAEEPVAEADEEESASEAEGAEKEETLAGV